MTIEGIAYTPAPAECSILESLARPSSMRLLHGMRH